jgi:hypothetical protein
MATVFTLPVLDFPRYNPGNLTADPTGMLKADYAFGWISEHWQSITIAY